MRFTAYGRFWLKLVFIALDSSARSAIVFRVPFVTKGTGAWGGAPLLRAKHGDSAWNAAKEKSAKGGRGGKQEFSPQQHYKSVQILLQNSPLDCF